MHYLNGLGHPSQGASCQLLHFLFVMACDALRAVETELNLEPRNMQPVLLPLPLPLNPACKTPDTLVLVCMCIV